MKCNPKPLRSTIAWGLLGGLVYLPLFLCLRLMLPWPLNFQLLFWALLAGYGILLSRWAFKPPASIVLPLLLLLWAALLIPSTTAFLFAALGTLSWMRSGICFNQTSVVNRFAAEAGLGLGSGLALSAAVPAAPLSTALAVWLFFLIQALYFIVFEVRSVPTAGIAVDPFERAKAAVEDILFRAGF